MKATSALPEFSRFRFGAERKDDHLFARRGAGPKDIEPAVRDVLLDGLQRSGFRVWLAVDGQEALEIYRDRAADIDVVLLDVRMPHLDGPQTLAALRAIAPQIRCCFMSGFLGRYTAESLLALGAATVIAKPFQLDEVIRVVCSLAGSGGDATQRTRSRPFGNGTETGTTRRRAAGERSSTRRTQ